MSHDYDPHWDYEPIAMALALPDEMDQAKMSALLIALDTKLSARLGFSEGFEAFYVAHGGLNQGHDESPRLAVYCDGTSSRPVLGLDIAAIRQGCEEHGLDLFKQIAISIVHELGHAFEETMGGPAKDGQFDEDAAEAFARKVIETGTVDLSMFESFDDADDDDGDNTTTPRCEAPHA